MYTLPSWAIDLSLYCCCFAQEALVECQGQGQPTRPGHVWGWHGPPCHRSERQRRGPKTSLGRPRWSKSSASVSQWCAGTGLRHGCQERHPGAIDSAWLIVQLVVHYLVESFEWSHPNHGPKLGNGFLDVKELLNRKVTKSPFLLHWAVMMRGGSPDVISTLLQARTEAASASRNNNKLQLKNNT